MGSNVEEVVRKLTEKAALFVDYTRSMGLSMNASKTQLLLSANAGNVANVTMTVDGNIITPSTTIKLLGVSYNRKLSTAPHVRSLLPVMRQRALAQTEVERRCSLEHHFKCHRTKDQGLD
jgi:hypothetical protein